MQAMLFDTTHNSAETAYRNMFQLLAESAMRSMFYVENVPGLQRAAPRLLWGESPFCFVHGESMEGR